MLFFIQLFSAYGRLNEEHSNALSIFKRH